jgi:halimadienyl-diphosphate synthase
MSAAGGADGRVAAQALIAELLDHPWGQVSPSVYETGRLVTLSPWLTGDAERIRFLLDTQRPDGGWGVPDDGYALVPTLSATEALLSARRRYLLGNGARDHGARDHGARDHGARDHGARDHEAVAAELTRAARRGLDLLSDVLSGGGPVIPDLPAVELIVPYLVALINRRLAGPDRPWPGGPLLPPAGMDEAKLTAVRGALGTGRGTPRKLWHALEVAGDVARGLEQIRPELSGTIGASPAATAAWLGDCGPAQPGDAARWHLETVSALHGGPVPCGFPITVFERAWVVTWLGRSGVPVSAPPQLVLSLTAPLGPDGTAAAAGLPADADTTAGALYALSLLDAQHRPDPLWEYETTTHFCTWPGEDGASTTTNAHVIEAFGHYLETMGPGRIGRDVARRYAAAIGKAAAWLRERQRAEGGWTDRWHASPYYATACCALALERFDRERSGAAVDRARRWVLATQRPDGSWGRWQGTAEETAYAVQILLNRGRGRGAGAGVGGDGDGDAEPPDEASVGAAMRGRAWLLRSLSPPGRPLDAAGAPGAPWVPDGTEPALWHDKDLYHPAAIVRAVVLGALHLTKTDRLAVAG